MSLKELVDGSDLKVVANVTAVEDSPPDPEAKMKRFASVKVATDGVVETWKGTAGREIRFLASPSWPCDVSTAEEGERVVLFLAKRKGGAVMMIGHSGQGRMPVRLVKGKTYATFWDEVELPKRTATIQGQSRSIPSSVRSN